MPSGIFILPAWHEPDQVYLEHPGAARMGIIFGTGAY